MMKLHIDPRTKLFMIFAVSIIVMLPATTTLAWVLRTSVTIIPIILLLTEKKYAAAAVFTVLYTSAAALTLLFISSGSTGLLYSLLVGYCGIVVQFLPSLITAWYAIKTTKIDEFMSAMQKMHMPDGIAVSLAVVMRFFPTIKEEYGSINDAMKMRGILFGGGKVGKMLEFRIIPLLFSCVNIGEELSAAAVTRGLGAPVRRTSICELRLGAADIILFAVLTLSTAALVLIKIRSADYMIELNNVNFTYKGTDEAGLHDLSLTIPDGETLLLCGESGCGKTTLTRLINGLIPHYYKGDLSGSVTVNGRNISETQLYELAGTVGTVFQNPRSQFFSIDTDGEIVFGPENIGMSPADILKRKEKVADDMELSPLLGRSLFELSGGEKQKIACASVSALMPDIMILDEPSSNLDWKAIDELKNIISLWKDQGKTVIISEHRLWYLSGLVDRVLFMRKGVIAHECSKDEFSELGTEELKSLGLRPTKLEEKYIKEFGEGIFGETINAVKQYKRSENDILIRDMYFSYGQPKRSISEKKNSDEERTLSIPELSLPKASVIALTGKNGAGKSTFLRCLCGLEKRCKVRLEIDGTGYSRKMLLKKSYMVMQDVNHQLFTDSVTAEVYLSMKDEDTEKCDRILDSLSLLELKDKHPMALSGGQKQRVAIASALAADAELLLFDEPTSGLDYAHMTAVAKLLKKLSSDGKTVIVSTHDPELIALCCDYVLCIERGKVKYFREA